MTPFNIAFDTDLPIYPYITTIGKAIRQGDNLIVIGQTGSGKTTQIPLIILQTLSEYQDLKKLKVVVTEPRRIAATSVAEYVSSRIGEVIGNTIGYKIRFKECKNEDTGLIFMTDGMLLRETQIDPLLSKYTLVMVDEAHERNINTDFLIGLLVDIQQKRKELEMPPLQIIITSATLEKEKFISFFSQNTNVPLNVIEIPGKLYPVYTFYEQEEINDFEYRASQIVQKICTNDIQSLDLINENNVNIPTQGDILIFMPGKGEIEKTKAFIKSLRNFEKLNLEIFTVHGDLTIQEQQKIFQKSNKRKVVIATNIAETSITIPGIKFVIDSGLIKVMEFNPHSGINSLVTRPHAIKGLEQRKGRAGRIEPGYYFALYTKESLSKRPEYPAPEILRSSLSQIVLIMKTLNINNVQNFKFIDQPSQQQIKTAINELKSLGALDKKENITNKGITMASLPLEPYISNLILEGNRFGCVETICTLASFLELKPVFLEINEETAMKQAVKEFLNSTSSTQTPFDSFSLLENLEDALDNDNYNNINQYYLYNHVNNISEIIKNFTPKQIKQIYKKANEIIEAVNVQQEKFKNKSSDFITLINVYQNWIKNNQDIQWAEQNFLSTETLIEATNIRQELLEIARENKLSYKDKISYDFERRLEKALISAFRNNILARQKNGLYENLVNKDKNIKIHSSSVLHSQKPKFLIASEVIKILDIYKKPQLSCRFLHEVNENILKEFIPKELKQYNKRLRKLRKSSRTNFSYYRNKKFKSKRRTKNLKTLYRYGKRF